LKYPPEAGGAGPDLLADAVVTEELARCGSGGVAACLGVHKDLTTLYVYRCGDPEQHARWLKPAIDGSVIGALAVTEPDAGSDVAGIKCTSRREDDGWLINGSKLFITNGSWAEFVVVAAMTDPKRGREGITLFIVEGGVHGFRPPYAHARVARR
jgi:acyl-CoA dehydrogenase